MCELGYSLGLFVLIISAVTKINFAQIGGFVAKIADQTAQCADRLMQASYKIVV